MYINSNNKLGNVYSNQTKSLSKESVKFKAGPNPFFLGEKAKIMASMDIFSKSPKILLPETELETKAVLEILEQRLKLNRFVRLRNEAREIRSKLNEANELIDKSKFAEAEALLAELDKRGNIDAILKTLDKQIEQEEKRNPQAFQYFEDLYKTMDNYLDKKLIKYSHLDRYYHQAKKNSINPDGKLSIAELIEIIRSGVNPNAPVVKTAPKILSRKDLLLTIEKEYEQLMREKINVYATAKENRDYNNQYVASRNARKIIQEKYSGAISKYPGIEKSMENIYKQLEKKYVHKVDSLVNTDIYPIGEIWDDMRPIEAKIKRITADIKQLKEKSALDPENQTLKVEVAAKEVLLAELREDWTKGMEYSLKYEAINRSRMIEAGKIEAYDYLVSENQTLKRHRLANEILKENNGVIPDSEWEKILE